MIVPERLAIVVPIYNEPGIGRTLQGLYDQNGQADVHHVVVNNGSTDDTEARIEAFRQAHDGFPLTVIEESQKGTGAASDTGFRWAIDHGYSQVARTDGDTVPTTDWTEKIRDSFREYADVMLLGGKTAALHDENYRRGDDVFMPLAVKAARAAFALQYGDRSYLRAVCGCNMATRRGAYEQVGGIDRTSIDELDEGVAYSMKIARAFGRTAIRIDPEMEAATSMRRVRQYGIVGTALHHLLPDRRTSGDKLIDIR